MLDGQAVQSVSGGGHWGGGMFINAYDMARFGLLTLHKGNWNGKQLISQQWVQQALTPTPVRMDYGYMNWFLNTGKKLLPSAPESAFMHVGNGANFIYTDPEHDLVMVVRWIDGKAMDAVVKKLLEALLEMIAALFNQVHIHGIGSFRAHFNFKNYFVIFFDRFL